WRDTPDGEVDDVRGVSTFDDVGHPAGPSQHRGAALGHQLGPVVDTGDTGTRAADVIDAQLNDVGPDAEFGHVGHHGAAKVVDHPRRDVHQPVEARLHLAPTADR